jgi:hypothetical protein
VLILVDGYNVTRADDTTRRLHPDDQRLALERRLATRGSQMLGPGEIVIVWDKGPCDDRASGVRVVFAGHEIADDVIVRMAEARAGDVTVVTSDRELRHRVRERAGRSTPVLPSSAAWESARGDGAGGGADPARRVRRGGSTRHPYGGLPKGHEKVTAELEDIWLDGSGSADGTGPGSRD